MAIFYNQASLSYGGQVTNSNTTEAELESGLTLTKTAITATYGTGDSIVYVVTLTNAGGAAYTELTLTDDLGAYTLGDGTTTVVPLTYVPGSIRYYLSGILQADPTVTTNGDLTVTGIALPANGTATLIYETRANGFAPLAAGSTITNTVRASGGACVGELTASATITASETAPQLTIAKAVYPPTLTDCGELTYTLIVQNLGNTPVNATDGVIIRDLFNPILSDITVTLDGAPLAEGTGYTYDETTGMFTTLDGAIAIPAATYTQDPETGVITTTPGVAVLTISGTV